MRVQNFNAAGLNDFRLGRARETNKGGAAKNQGARQANAALAAALTCDQLKLLFELLKTGFDWCHGNLLKIAVSIRWTWIAVCEIMIQ